MQLQMKQTIMCLPLKTARTKLRVCHTPDDGQTSDPRGLLFGAIDWQGPATAWPADKVILFNIPVDATKGLAIQRTHYLMANRLKVCSAIWNVQERTFKSWSFDSSTSTSLSTWIQTPPTTIVTSTSIEGVTGTVLVVTEIVEPVLTFETVSRYITTEYMPSVVVAAVTVHTTSTTAATWTLTDHEMEIAPTTLTVKTSYTITTETTVSVFNSITGVRETTETVYVEPP